jgi:uncharacterized protein YuzE
METAKTSCTKVTIDPAACYLQLADAKTVTSEVLEFGTARGETMILDFDADGRVIGIELIGAGKPCQQTVAPGREEEGWSSHTANQDQR